MSLYLVLDLLVAAGPVVLSFDRKVSYFRKWSLAFATAAVVGIPYLAWDVLAAHAGTWSWSSSFAGPPLVFSLPLGELAFFLVVPFGCLFIYEVLSSYLPERRFRFPRWIPFAVAVASFFAAATAAPRAYTVVVLVVFGLFFLLTAFLRPSLFEDRTVWAALVASFLPFAVVNGVLTALPVVIYNQAAILGPRIVTIPVEDFLYSFSFVGYLLLVYRTLGGRPALQGGRRGEA